MDTDFGSCSSRCSPVDSHWLKENMVRCVRPMSKHRQTEQHFMAPSAMVAKENGAKGAKDQGISVEKSEGPWASSCACSAQGPRPQNEDVHVTWIAQPGGKGY